MPYRQSPEEIFASLATSRAGLSSAEAAQRLARDGANRLETVTPIHPLRIFLNQFKSFKSRDVIKVLRLWLHYE